MNTISKIFLPIVLLVACDSEDTDNAEPNDIVAQANDGAGSHRGRGGLKKLDIDGDGMISVVEASDSRLASRFAELDADKDGKLSKDELHAGKGQRKGPKDPAERAAHFMKKFDANNDGALAFAELGDHPKLADKLTALDADKDGKLTLSELQAWKGKGKGERGERGGWHDMDPSARAAKMIARLDGDKDGVLSAAEVAEHPRFAGKFAEVDTDQSGTLSSAELSAFKATHTGKRGHGGAHSPV